MAEDIIRLVHAFEISDSLLKMDPQKGGARVQRTISAYTNRMFLDALLATAAFEEYFSVAVDLSVVITGVSTNNNHLHSHPPFRRITPSHSAGIFCDKCHAKGYLV